MVILFDNNLYCFITNLNYGSIAWLNAGANECGSVSANGTACLLAIRSEDRNMGSVINTFHFQDTTFALNQNSSCGNLDYSIRNTLSFGVRFNPT